MNKRRRYRSVLVLGTVGLLLTGVCGLWLRAYRRQEALNRQLIAALVKKDIPESIALVNNGADPNTPYEPFPPPSLRQLWNHLLHHSFPRRDESTTAFLMACGEDWQDEERNGGYDRPDAPQLVLAMLRYGANCHTKDVRGFTPLCWAVCHDNPRTLRVLLHHGAKVNVKVYPGGVTPLMMASFYPRPEIAKLLLYHGANVNERDDDGQTALYDSVHEAIGYQYSSTPKLGDILIQDIVPQLLAHGADPNLPEKEGKTVLQIVLNDEKPLSELVALLKQAGAKK